MICEVCKCRLEADEESDIAKLIEMNKKPPQICTECLMDWVEEPAKTEWEIEINQPH